VSARLLKVIVASFPLVFQQKITTTPTFFFFPQVNERLLVKDWATGNRQPGTGDKLATSDGENLGGKQAVRERLSCGDFRDPFNLANPLHLAADL